MRRSETPFRRDPPGQWSSPTLGRGRVFSLLLAVIPAAACIIDTVPLPEMNDTAPAPEDGDHAPASGRGYPIDDNALYYTNDPMLLVGAPWAVPEAVLVVAENPARQNWRGQIRSAENGSFNMPLNGGAGDEITISVVADDITIDTTTLRLKRPSVAAFAANSSLSAILDPEDDDPAYEELTVEVWPPDEYGLVTITASPDSLMLGISVVVANTTAGTAAVGDAQPDGSLFVQVAGSSGDELAVFAVEPASSNAGGGPISLWVP